LTKKQNKIYKKATFKRVMFNQNTGIFTTAATSSTSLFDEVRTALLRNATSTLTSEAQALLHSTFAKDWNEDSLSLSIPIDAAGSSLNFLSPKALTNTISPVFSEHADIDFGENTLDWVSSLYNKLPNTEEICADNELQNCNELNFNGLRKLSISDTIQEEDEDDEVKNKATTLSCLQCGFIATNRKQLWRHGKRENHVTRSSLIKSESTNKKHGNKEISEHRCDFCSYSSKSRFNVLRHFQRVHINQKSTSCDQCDKQFKDIDTLKTHIKYTHNSERKFSCDLCDKQFVSSSDLQRHRKIVHEKIRDYFCQKCGKNFQIQSNAKRHFLEVCSGTKALQLNSINNGVEEIVLCPTYNVQLPLYETE
jgi:transcription elongation factor Elf1